MALTSIQQAELEKQRRNVTWNQNQLDEALKVGDPVLVAKYQVQLDRSRAAVASLEALSTPVTPAPAQAPTDATSEARRKAYEVGLARVDECLALMSERSKLLAKVNETEAQFFDKMRAVGAALKDAGADNVAKIVEGLAAAASKAGGAA